MPATLDDVAQLALALPEVVEGERHGGRTWLVDGKVFAWERPFSKADIKRFGTERVPEGEIVAVRVSDMGEKEAVLADETKGVFDMAHFYGFPGILIELKKVTKKALREALIDGWSAMAPDRLARETPT